VVDDVTTLSWRWRTHNALVRALGDDGVPLLIWSCLGWALVFARIAVTFDWSLNFLRWNLFLAWLPWAAARTAVVLEQRRRLPWPALGAFVFVWLAFLPNAPYLVTDFVHVGIDLPGYMLFDALTILVFALIGVGLALTSLRALARVVLLRTNWWVAALFVVTSSFLTGFGVYLGRVLRWNTWDILMHPENLMWNVRALAKEPPPGMQRITIVIGVFLLVSYLLNAAWRRLRHVRN
jgi:uncharacterized membrane protein